MVSEPRQNSATKAITPAITSRCLQVGRSGHTPDLEAHRRTSTMKLVMPASCVVVPSGCAAAAEVSFSAGEAL
jgi:hypothetical protein